MKRILLYLCVILITGFLAMAEDKDKSSDKSAHASAADQKLMDTEKNLWEAWKNKDSKAFEDNLSSDFVGVDAAGMSNKSAAIAMIGAGRCEVKDYALSDSKVTWLDKDATLLNYKVNQHASCDGKPVPENVLASSVMINRNGKWLEAFHSEVPAEPSMDNTQH